MVIQYVVVGTFPNQHKKPFVVMADNPTEAIQKVLAEGNDGFQSIEVMETYCKLTIIGGATIMTNKSCRYKNALEAMEFINNEMYKWGIQDATDDMSEPSESFQDRFNGFFGELSEDEQKILLSTLGVAKGLVDIAEKAGHDCL